MVVNECVVDHLNDVGLGGLHGEDLYFQVSIFYVATQYGLRYWYDLYGFPDFLLSR